MRGNGMQFIENKGQIADMNNQLRPDILYMGDGGGAKIYLRKTGVSYVLTKIEGLDGSSSGPPDPNEFINILDERKQNLSIKGCRVDMDFLGANTNPIVLSSQQVEGYFNYYLSHCPDGITNVNAYNKVVYENIYNNIDIAYYGEKKNGLKYDLIVKPGGDPSAIKMHYTGASNIEIVNSAEGEKLIVETSLGKLTEWMPRVYQTIGGKIIDVKANYILNGTTVSLKLAEYNSMSPLIIDPWLTYYGGSSVECSTGTAADKAGNVSMTGVVISLNYPVTVGAFQTTNSGGPTWDDSFVVKFDPSGNRIWSTYYGGTDDDVSRSITTDNNNAVIIAGQTSSINFPVSASAHQPIYANGWGDAFVVKFNSNGTRAWATYYGGKSGWDCAKGVATDAMNSVIITGITQATNFPVTASAFQATYKSGYTTIFLVQFDASGVRQWATFCGGTGTDNASSIAIDSGNNILITGYTTSADFPVTSTGTFQMTYAGGVGFGDAFIAKFTNSGTLIWTTYFGTKGDEEAVAIAIDLNGDIAITGDTRWSGTLPVTAGCYKSTSPGGVVDGFVAKFSSTGSLLWSTYLGSIGYDIVAGCATDKHNNIFIVWEVEDMDPRFVFPCAYQKGFGGGLFGAMEDQIITKFDAAGKHICDTYLGGPDEEDADTYIGGIATYNGFIYLSSNVSGPSFPVSANAFQKIYGGSRDVTMTKLCGMSCGDTTTFNNITIFSLQTGTSCYNITMDFTQNYSPCDTANIFYQWDFTGATTASSSAKNPSNIVYPTTGSYPVSLKIITDCDTVLASTIVTLTVSPTTTSVSSNTTICSGSITTLSVNGATSYSWSPATGLNSSNSAVVNASPNSTTTYTVSGIALNGCNYSLPVTVNVNAKPSIQISGSSVICPGATVSLSASGATNYSWNTGATSTAIQIAPTTNNIYAVTGTDANGCTAITSKTVSIYSLPIVTIIGSSPICIGNTSTLTAIGAFTYSWNTTNTNQTISVSPSITTTYSVIGTDANGCTGSSHTIVTVNSLPIANAGSDINFCQGSSSQLNALGGTNYSWTPATGLNNNNIANPIANPITTTNYTVTVSDGNGCSSTDDILITINALPIANAGQDDSICKGISTTLQATGGISYSWSPAASLSNAVINNPTAAPLTTTTYTVVVTDVNGCTGSDNTILYVLNPPAVNAGSDVSTCFGNSIWLSAAGASAYSWSPSTGLSATTISNPVSTTTTTISYTVTGYAFGCSSSDIIVVTVNALPLVSFTADNTSGCESVCVNLTNTTINTVTALWTFGDGNISQKARTNNCYYNTGSYNVSLTITDANGCSNTLTQPSLITVYPKPIANFTMNPSVVSINSPVNFIDLSTNANSWQWEFGDQPGKNSQLQNPVISFGDSGSYNVRLIVSNEFGCSDTATRMLYIMTEYTFYAPNTFTPDGNDLNDLFYPMGVGIDVANYHFWIYDRWGTLIWQTTNPGDGWNGKALDGNKVAQIDTYVWKIVLKDIFGVKHSYIGSVNLVR